MNTPQPSAPLDLPVSSSSVIAPPCATSSFRQAEWFEQEVHIHDGQLKAYLRGAFPAVHDVDDVVQESYLRMWRRHTVEPIRTAKAYLFTIARRLAIDWIRHEKSSVVDAVEDLNVLPVYNERSSSVDAATRTDTKELLAAAVDALPARCREVVILRKFKLLSTRETALKLGLKEQTVEMQLSRGNTRIREYLAARGMTSVLGRDA